MLWWPWRGKQLTRHLVSYLQDPSDIVRRYAVDALLRLKDPAALGALVRAARRAMPTGGCVSAPSRRRRLMGDSPKHPVRCWIC